MNPSIAAARDLVGALAAAGVREIVLCPGSRSAPLAYALHAADAAGVLRLHVRHDERAAAFTALGLSLASATAADQRVPAAVVTTSGTAVANLHPAVLEASEAGVPLLLLTADRPHRLRGTWANQTTALQAGIFGAATRYTADLPAPAADAGTRAWREAVPAAVAAARGRPRGPRPGPAHLDLAFDDPLVPDAVPPPQPLTPQPRTPGRVPAGPQADAGPPGQRAGPDVDGPVLPAGPRTVLVAGAGAGSRARRLADQADWPLLAEPSSGARWGPRAVGPYRLLLDADGLGARVERAVVLGRPTLSRPVTRLLERPGVEIVQVLGHDGEPGPHRPATRVLGPVRAEPAAPTGWTRAWSVAGAAAARAVDAVLDAAGCLNGPLLARETAAATAAGDVLVTAGSNPVRDLDLAAAVWDGPRLVLANRGLSGIDGTLSTAVGAALASGATTRVLLGDLAFLHDLNGLLLGPAEPEPRVQAVVLNDDGGGIFGLLEHGDPERAGAFERVFGTPHGADLAGLCAGLGVRHDEVGDVPRLRELLRNPAPGRSVVEVRASRSGLRDLHARIAAAVALAVREAAA